MGLFACTDFNRSDSARDQWRLDALESLRSVLHSDMRWQRVHAAEFLSSLDYVGEVDSVFRPLAQSFKDSIYYRHGIWRVLALTASPSERSRWIAKIEEVLADPDAPDKIHAVESLAKLRIAPPADVETSSDSVYDAFALWASAYQSIEAKNLAIEKLVSFFEGNRHSDREKGIAAYALRHLGGLDDAERSKIVHAVLNTISNPDLHRSLLVLAILQTSSDATDHENDQRLSNDLQDLTVSGSLPSKRDLALVLAERGSETDIPLLQSYLNVRTTDEPALAADVRAAAAYAMLRIDRRYQPTLAWLDWVVIVFYGALMLAIGWYYSRRNKTAEDYQLGGRNMNSVSVGISLFATLLSTVSYLSYPGEMIKYGPVIFTGMFGFPLVYFVAGWWLIPRIMEMKVTSAYEILELRLGTSIRMLAIFMFLSLRFLWMATIVYVTVEIAFLSVVNIAPGFVPVLSILLIVITIIYTSMGGLKAVVTTDVIQTIVFLGGALISILIVSYDAGSFGALIPGEWSPVWKPLRLGFDPQERTTVGNAVMMLFAWYICTTGSDQLAIQRYLSTKDIQAARNSLKVSLYANLVAKLLLALLGLAMLTFFSRNQHFLVDGQKLGEQADTLFPRFILIGLPVGLSGLVIAGLLAAAMSSLSSGLNSVSTVISEDIIKRFSIIKGKFSNLDALRQIQILSYLTGFVVMILSLMVANVQGTLFDVLIKVTHLFVAPLFVLFFMALFIPFSTEKGTFLGGMVSIFTAVSISFFGALGITVFWVLPCSFLMGTGIAVTFSYFENKLTL
ncbi:MAG: hypothetical protein KDC53_09195 [Saprospiraceae bacterium]|nr:hypothetical protein [Saprospiraceae bacterium]